VQLYAFRSSVRLLVQYKRAQFAAQRAAKARAQAGAQAGAADQAGAKKTQ
jgi:hypothetical protein